MKRFSAYCWGAVRVGASICLIFTCTQCTLTVDADQEQCTTTKDCQGLGKAFVGSVCKNAVCVADPAWSCRKDSASSSKPGSGTVTIRVPLVDVISELPIAGVAGQLHPKIDSDLIRPIGDPFFSDADGIIAFTVDKGFDGFAALSHNAIAPSLYFFNPPATSNSTWAPARLTSMETAAGLVSQLGGTIDPTRGFIIVTAEDCNGDPAEGISYTSREADSKTQVFYSVDGLVTTKTSATDPSGYGGFIAVRPGSVSITGSHETHGKIGEISLFVRAGEVSYSRMVPSAD